MRDDQQLRHYLLGDLSEREMEGLEERLFRDDELFELAEAIESELLEEYAHGGLSSRERGRVARRLAATPAGKLRLAMIRGLSQPTEAAPARVLPFQRPTPPQSEARPEFRISAIAAMLAILLAGGWLALQKGSLPPLMSQSVIPTLTPFSSPAVEPPPAPPDRTSGNSVASERIAQTPPAPTPTPPARSLTTAVLQIAVMAIRGQEEAQERIVPKGTDRVELQFVLSAPAEGYSSYRLALNDAAGEPVAVKDGLRPKRVGSDRVLALTVDAQQLPEGLYTAEIRGLTAAGEAEDLAFQEFQIHVNQ